MARRPLPPGPRPPRRTADDGLDRALEVVGDRWTLSIVAGLEASAMRFGDLGERLGIATNVLADRLRRLEQAGLVVATPYQQRPVRVEYALTEDGRRLAGAIALLAAWGAEREGRPGGRRRHDVCGTELEVRLWCPTCEQPVDTAPDGSDDSTGDDGLVWV